MNGEGLWLQWLQGIALGLIQGATEFIPVSSSGHLVLLAWLFGWQPPSLLFDTMVHWGTLVGLLAVLWRDLWKVAAGWIRSVQRGDFLAQEARLGWYLILGSIPAAVLGVALERFFEELFSSPGAVAIFLLLTGSLLALGERRGGEQRDMAQIGVRGALWIGLAQAAAIAPGLSRSGATMAAGMSIGLGRATAARFSFLLSIPVILGAGLFQLAKLPAAANPNPEWALVAFGFFSAAISGYLVVRFLLRYLQRRSLLPFALYCWAIGATVLLAVWIGL